ncbi:MAG: HD domain-containing protein [Desulfobulbus sp.]|nr:HD domain-containing protein [Desulfobulbus sp.]
MKKSATRMVPDRQFQQEVLQLHHQRVYSILLVGIGIMLLFTALDYLLIREHFFEFLRYRLGAVSFVGLLLVANYFDRNHTRAWVIGFTGYLFAGCLVLLTVFRMGGIASPYYVGVIVAMTIYTALAPLSAGQTLVSGFALVTIYLVSMTLIGPLSEYEVVSLFTNLYFMICFVFIAATQSWADNSARQQEYRLRQEENLAAEKLTQQAKFLEKEVQRRTEEQQATEQRFRILYEAIVDDVLLVTVQGQILQANQHYLTHYYCGDLPGQASFLDAVAPQDRMRVDRELLQPLAQGAAISAWRIALRSCRNTPVEVEISGALLQRGERKLGIQLVLRDITIRQELEQKLITSLNRVRKMENAAILALAKLSEYRDVTPGNHLERIREYCRLLAVELARRPEYADQLTPNFIQNLFQGAILHDIGKVAVPDEILGKKSAISLEEEALIRLHTRKGGDVIKTMMEDIHNSGFLTVAQNIAYFHHERWDGRGYPQGLRGDKIPLEARIMALADAYEEQTATLSPDKRKSHAQTVQMIIEEVGHKFDPALVDAFLLIQDSFNWVRQTLAEPDSD